MSVATQTQITAEQLLRMRDDGYRRELIAGEIRTMSPPNWLHCAVECRLGARLSNYVETHGLGIVLVGDPGFLLARDPDTVLAPDAAFIRSERIPPELPEHGYWPGPPDLAVEVVAPRRPAHAFHEKASAWLDAGVAMVWVVHPARRAITVYQPGAEPEILSEGGYLDGHDLLPGFRCRVADLFRLR
jgi:Uma2 family endonuclease